MSCGAAAIQNLLYSLMKTNGKTWSIPPEWVVRAFLETVVDPNHATSDGSNTSQFWGTNGRGATPEAMATVINMFLGQTDLNIRYKVVPAGWTLKDMDTAVTKCNAPAIFTTAPIGTERFRHAEVCDGRQVFYNEPYGGTANSGWCYGVIDSLGGEFYSNDPGKSSPNRAGEKVWVPNVALDVRLKNGSNWGYNYACLLPYNP